MNDVVKANLDKFKVIERNKCYALANWITRKSKDFSLNDALYYLYMYTGGDYKEMAKIIGQLSEKKKMFGRTQVYNTEQTDDITLRLNDDGKLELIGYKPDKEPQRKGQHIQRNPKIFRKGDGQTNVTFKNSEERIMDFGKKVRELYPDADNQYLTHAMIAIKRFSNDRKISPEKVMNRLAKGTLKLLDYDYNSFRVVPVANESRIIVITESVFDEINKSMGISEYKFYNNVKSFLSSLLADPVNTKPSDLLLSYGITKKVLINQMISLGMLERSVRISDKDENGEPKEATMMVKYKVPKKNFERKLNRLWIRLFEKNLPPRKQRTPKSDELNEEGEGATSAVSSGEVVTPLFPIQRRKMPTEVEEATAGNYEYDVPFAGDEETLARHNGKGGSVSVNLA